MAKKSNKLTPLFIEDLGEVKGGCGGGNATTLAIGEEGGVTSFAIGEEDDWGGGGGATTFAIGEEDGFTGPGDGGATTLALGEE